MREIDLHIEDISLVKPINNKVLVVVNQVSEESASGLIVGNSEWDKAGHVTRSGVVVRLPEKLIYRSKRGWGIEWDTQIECEVGDVVYWGIMEASDCPVLSCNGLDYFLVDYSELRLAIGCRWSGYKKIDEVFVEFVDYSERYIPLNGFIILEEVKESTNSSILITEHGKKRNKKKGIVKYAGSKNKEYFPKDSYYDADVEVGDEVLFFISGWTELEDERHATLENKLGYCQRRWISAKLN